ncbi:uncharacterized protein [Henckelia pumila]|uniref:uncharacterized protein n=1 Tax=Henckelia pumila TaxID=405737 RepID=UPI003C6E2A32
MLDAAANGSIFMKTPADAWEISDVGCPDLKKEKKVRVLEVDALTSLNTKIDALTHQMSIMQTAPENQVQANMPEEKQLFEVDATNFAGNQGRQSYNPYRNTYNPGWKNQPNFSWNPPENTANTSKPVEKKPSFEEIIMKYVASTETWLQYQEAMLRKLKTWLSQIATQLSTRPIRALPSNTEKNPRDMNVIMVITRSQSEVGENNVDGKETLQPSTDKKKEDKPNSTESLPTGKKSKVLAKMPSYAKFLKEILSNKRKLVDFETIKLSEECSAILQNKLPPKLKDPGSFSIPCTIGKSFFSKALCDLCASINLMPCSCFQKLGIGEVRPTTISLQLADRSIKYLRGIVEDVLVKVDKFIFPVDFVVLDMKEDLEIPLILGRPFLANGKSLIDVHKEN